MQFETEPSTPSKGSEHRIREARAAIRPDDAAMQAWYERYSTNHLERIAFDLDLIEARQAFGTRVLELGSIPLLLTAAIAGKYEVTGVDISPERFSGAIQRLGLKVIAHNAETARLPFADSSFDAVVFNELFEHLRINPVFTLGEVHRVLAPTGKLFLSTPNLLSYDGLINLLLHGKAYSCSGEIYEEYAKLQTLGHMGHVREYTPVEVATFLLKIGFRVEVLIYRGKIDGRVGQTMAKLLPRLRPFISYIATKAPRAVTPRVSGP